MGVVLPVGNVLGANHLIVPIVPDRAVIDEKSCIVPAISHRCWWLGWGGGVGH